MPNPFDSIPNSNSTIPVDQDPFANAPIGQVPTGQPPFGNFPNGQTPVGQDPFANAPIGQVPTGQPAPIQTPVYPIPEYMRDFNPRDDAFLQPIGKGKLLKVVFGDEYMTGKDGSQVHNPGDPTHRLRLHFAVSSFGVQSEQIITVVTDKLVRDDNGNIIDRIFDESVAKRADATLKFMFDQYQVYDWTFASVSGLVGKDISQQNIEIDLFVDGSYTKGVPFVFQGGGTYLERDDQTFQNFLADPTFPGKSKVPVKIAKISYKKFKSGQNTGVPYIDVLVELLNSPGTFANVRNFSTARVSNRSLKLPMEGTDNNKTLNIFLEFAGYIGAQFNYNEAVESQISKLVPSDVLKFSMSIQAGSSTRSDGTVAYNFILNREN